MDLIHFLRHEFEKAAKAEVRNWQENYMRNQFVFFGVQKPLRAAIQKEALRHFDIGDVRELAEALWQQPEREMRYAALDFLAGRKATLLADDLPFIESLIQRDSWWDTVDVLAPSIIGPLAIKHAEMHREMDKWVKHPYLWNRRSSLIYQLSSKGHTDEPRLFANCLALAADPDFFIRKAIGWALRQQARRAPEKVLAFLEAQQSKFSPLSLREAKKHL